MLVISCNTIKTPAKLDLSNTKRQGSSLFIKLTMTDKNKAQSIIIGMCECVDLFQRETAARSECYCDGRIEMSAGDVTKRVNKNHDSESPNDGDPWKSHGFVVLSVHSH